MGIMFFLLFVVVVLLVLVVALKVTSRGGIKDAEWPFDAKAPLSKPEQALYFRLVKALPEQVVLAQVQLSSLLAVQKNHDRRAWFNRINRMSADFVVCDRGFNVLAVIELDDATHERPDRVKADEKKDQVLAAAGIRLIRWQAKSLPDEALIQSTFKSV